MEKICTKCGQNKELSLENFYVDKKRGFKRWCKKCHNTCVSARSKANRGAVNKNRQRRRQNPNVKAKEAEYSRKRYAETPGLKEYNRAQGARWRAANPLKWMSQVAKYRAKKAGLPFDEDLSDIVIPEFCPILGLRLSKGTGKACAASPSLDRIVPSLGYVKGNRWVISNRANTMKNDATLDEIILLGKWAQRELECRG
jgi:hypothetical protein